MMLKNSTRLRRSLRLRSRPPSRPRDQAGKFVETRGAPEPMFAPRGD